MRKVPFLVLTAILLALCATGPAAAIMNCYSCTEFDSCCRPCIINGVGTVTCGYAGTCAGDWNCGGGGCPTAAGLEAFLASLDQKPAQVTSVNHRRAQVAARLTWRLAQRVEEDRLGTIYAGADGFRLAGPRGRILAADIALVGAGGTPDRAPALAVVLAGRPGAQAEVARWRAAGSAAVVLVDPEARTVRLHHGGEAVLLRGDDVLELPDLLPGWSLRVSDLFE